MEKLTIVILNGQSYGHVWHEEARAIRDAFIRLSAIDLKEAEGEDESDYILEINSQNYDVRESIKSLIRFFELNE